MGRPAKNQPEQLSLLELLQQQEDTLLGRSKDEPGCLNMGAPTRHAMNEMIKECPFNRYEIAARMSFLLDQEVTKTMIDSWTSESKEGHRFPLEFAAAFCEACGVGTKVLEVNCRPAGLFAVESPDAIRVQLSKIEEDRKKLQKQEGELKKALKLFK